MPLKFGNYEMQEKKILYRWASTHLPAHNRRLQYLLWHWRLSGVLYSLFHIGKKNTMWQCCSCVWCGIMYTISLMSGTRRSWATLSAITHQHLSENTIGASEEAGPCLKKHLEMHRKEGTRRYALRFRTSLTILWKSTCARKLKTTDGTFLHTQLQIPLFRNRKT